MKFSQWNFRFKDY